jgi:hypothetical protein
MMTGGPLLAQRSSSTPGEAVSDRGAWLRALSGVVSVAVVLGEAGSASAKARNIEEARELGEKKLEEIERAKVRRLFMTLVDIKPGP